MPVRYQRLLILFFAIIVFATNSSLAKPAPEVTVGNVTSSQPLRDGIEVQAGPVTMRVTALRDDIVRVRIFSGSASEDASWAVLSGPREKSVEVKATQDDASVGFRTAALDVRVERDPLRLVIRDLAGTVIADAVGRPIRFQLGGFTIAKDMPGGEHYFGLGDKTGAFDRRGQAYTLWNTDVGPQESVDPLYKAIPFFMGIKDTRSYGLFLDNTWRTVFDFGKHRPRTPLFLARKGGPLDYYFIYGPTPKQVLESYAYLTGTPPLPPLWAFGFQQSRYSYTPESQVREIATRLRTEPDSVRRAVSRHRLPVQESSLHGRSHDVPELSRPHFRSAQAALSRGHHY